MFVTDMKCIPSIKKQMSSAPFLSIDVETTGLNVRRDTIIGLGISFGYNSYYFHGADIIRAAAEAVRDSGTPIIAWNAYFDLEMINNQIGIDLWQHLHADVLMLKHTVDENPPFGLKECAAKYFGSQVLSQQTDLKASIAANGGSKNEFFKAAPRILGKYCEQDCKLTERLFHKLSAELKAEGLEKFFYEDEVMPLYKEVTRHMQSRGVHVNVDLIRNSYAAIETDAVALEARILAAMAPLIATFNQQKVRKAFPQSRRGKFAQAVAATIPEMLPEKSGKYGLSAKVLSKLPESNKINYLRGSAELSESELNEVYDTLIEKNGTFNLNSKKDLAQIIVKQLDIAPLAVTEKTKQPKVDDEFIQHVGTMHAWAADLSDLNKLRKMQSTYMERILELQEDGIFYPQWKQHGTVSGRYSGDLQQLPRQAEPGQFSDVVAKYRNLIRTFFVAGCGNKLVDADYESLEPHVFSHVSNEEGIRDIFRKNHDFYSTIAIATERLQGVSADKADTHYLGKVDKAKRQRAKSYSLGIPYGMESWKLAKTLEIEQSEAERLIQAYLGAYPNLAGWMASTKEAVLRELKVCSQLGRVRRYKELRDVLAKWNPKVLDNALDLWQSYHEDKTLYAAAKAARRVYKNCVDNAKNFQIQSLSASIVNRACIAINRKFESMSLAAYIICQIHDQIIVEADETIVDKVRDIVQNEMENVIKLSVQLKAPAQIGANFADAH